jgi:peptide chain release factor 3
MAVKHPRSGKLIKLSRPYKFFAESREVVEEAYAGDIIGLPGSRYFGIGDTVSAGQTFNFAPMPRFPAEHFARLINLDVSKQKQFQKGLEQLATEGAMQVLYEAQAQRRDPILAVVGVLQFEVVEGRLSEEYGVTTRREMLPHQLSRWVEGPEAQIELLPWRYSMMRTVDENGRLVALFSSPHELNFYAEKYPEIAFKSVG